MQRRNVQVIRIAKGDGRFRTIYVLPSNVRRALRCIIPEIRAATPANPSAHGFCPGRSIVTNARVHVGYRYTLSFDLRDFFDTVTEAHLSALPDRVRRQILFDGAIRQGPPTSPDASNLAAEPFDRAVRRAIDYIDRIAYTRYADDMTFSFDDPACVRAVREIVHTIAAENSFKINDDKEALQDAARGRRWVTGVMVDDAGIYPPRSVKRRLRAAIHHRKSERASGLKEFCLLRPPKTPEAEHAVANRLVTAAAAATPASVKATGSALIFSYARRIDV